MKSKSGRYDISAGFQNRLRNIPERMRGSGPMAERAPTPGVQWGPAVRDSGPRGSGRDPRVASAAAEWNSPGLSGRLGSRSLRSCPESVLINRGTDMFYVYKIMVDCNSVFFLPEIN